MIPFGGIFTVGIVCRHLILALVGLGFVIPAPKAGAVDTYSYAYILGAPQDALFNALQGQDEQILAFYEARKFQPFWMQDDARLAGLIDVLERAGEHGLPVLAYDPGGYLDRAVHAETLTERATAEVDLTKLFLRYARDLNTGLLTPRDVDSEIYFQPAVMGATALLTGVANAPSVLDYSRMIMPQDPGYARLMEEKLRLEAIVSSGGWGDKVPARNTLRPGRSSNAVATLRARLQAMGYGYLGSSRTYDAALVTTVKLAQSRLGLNTDGVAGPGTLGALNVSAQERLRQVVVNLERARWLNVPGAGRYIRVNLADQMMRVVDDGVTTFTSRVVIGRNQLDLRTPEFSHEMTHMIINPFWHVPKSIAQREYLPLLQQDPLALEKRGLWLLNRKGQRLNTAGADFNVFSEGNFPFLIKQPPGGRNALGRVKFMFPNRHNIYLHDTPAKSLFVKDRRIYSHGCVRVQRPYDLAYHLLGAQDENPVGTFHWLLKRGTERQVDFETPVPIFLSYNSAWVGEDGVPQYRGDVYKRDRRIFRALESAGVRVAAAAG